MVWSCPEEGLRICGKEDAGNGSARQEEEGETKEKNYGRSEGGHVDDGGSRRRGARQSEMETSDPLWRPQMGIAERRSTSIVSITSSILVSQFYIRRHVVLFQCALGWWPSFL